MNARALLDEVSGRNQWDLRGWVGAGSFHALRHPPTDRRASAEPVGRKGRWHDITANWLGRDECLQVKWDGDRGRRSRLRVRRDRPRLSSASGPYWQAATYNARSSLRDKDQHGGKKGTEGEWESVGQAVGKTGARGSKTKQGERKRDPERERKGRTKEKEGRHGRGGGGG